MSVKEYPIRTCLYDAFISHYDWETGCGFWCTQEPVELKAGEEFEFDIEGGPVRDLRRMYCRLKYDVQVVAWSPERGLNVTLMAALNTPENEQSLMSHVGWHLIQYVGHFKREPPVLGEERLGSVT